MSGKPAMPLDTPIPGPLPKCRKAEGSRRKAQESQAAPERRSPVVSLGVSLAQSGGSGGKGAGGWRKGVTECTGTGEPAMPLGTFLAGAA